MKSVDKLVEQLRQRCEWLDDYYTSDEGNPTADYVASVGYNGEALHQVEDQIRSMWHHDLINDLERDFLTSVIELNKNQATQIIMEISSLHFTPNIYAVDYEICSASLGEIEDEIDDDLLQQIIALNSDERGYLISQANHFCGLMISSDNKSAYVYLDHNYERWSLVLDRELLNKKMNEMMITGMKSSYASNKKSKKLEVIK